jgi:hypothetical protein
MMATTDAAAGLSMLPKPACSSSYRACCDAASIDSTLALSSVRMHTLFKKLQYI